MLSREQLKKVEELVGELNLDSRQIVWLSGWLSGWRRESSSTSAEVSAAASASPSETATILYGSQTGNGKAVAERLAAAAKARGLAAEVFAMDRYKTARLKKEKFLFLIVSTHGEGEPPDSAAGFFRFLESARAPKLSAAYSLLALGDSSYEKFCQAGRDLDSLLQKLGASPLTELTECDLDFEQAAAQWQAAAVESLAQTASPPSVAIVESRRSDSSEQEESYSRRRPFSATVLRRLILNPPRKTMHFELSLENSGLRHRPGDSLGIFPRNCPQLCKRAAEQLQLDWESDISIGGERAAAGEWLSAKLDIALLTPPSLMKIGDAIGGRLKELAADSQRARAYLQGRGLTDILAEFPPPPSLQNAEGGAMILSCLRRLTPRLYSLANSAMAREDEAHLLAAPSAYYDSNGHARLGVCSDYLTRLQEGDTAEVFVQENENFRLPDDNSAPILMIGAGTGIAPYRAFMEEREARGAAGDNWIIFGERSRRRDFYYQTEWQAHQGGGLLSAMDVAFSRDGNRKVYVQDKLAAQSGRTRELLDGGGYVYVCGDEKGMARGVEKTLRDIVGGGDNERGGELLKTMQNTGRYQRDVY